MLLNSSPLKLPIHKIRSTENTSLERKHSPTITKNPSHEPNPMAKCHKPDIRRPESYSQIALCRLEILAHLVQAWGQQI